MKRHGTPTGLWWAEQIGSKCQYTSWDPRTKMKTSWMTMNFSGENEKCPDWNVRTQPVLNSIFLMVKTDQGHLRLRRVRLNPGIQPIPWPDTKKWSKSWSCSQDDFAHRWFQKFLNMSIHVRIYFNLKLHFRDFRKNLEMQSQHFS